MMIDKTVEADTDTFCDFLFAQGVDIYGLTQIIDDCQFCSRVSLGDDALGLTKLCPTTVHRFCLRCDRSGEARLLTAVVVSQLYDDERHLLIVPEVAPATYHLLQIVGIRGGMARVRLALVPHHTTKGIGSQRMKHGIIERRGQVLQ